MHCSFVEATFLVLRLRCTVRKPFTVHWNKMFISSLKCCCKGDDKSPVSLVQVMEPDQAQACQNRSLSEIQSVQATITMRKINRSLKLWVYQVILKFPECTNTCSGLAGWVIGWPEAGQLPVQWWGTEIHILLDPDKYIFYYFFTYSQPGHSFINFFVQYSQSDLPPLRPLCSEAPGRDSNLGRADLVAGTPTFIMILFFFSP